MKICRKEATTLVPIPATHSASGLAEWKLKGIDYCLRDIINTHNARGDLTLTCCCGHGKREGEIILQDGTKIILPKCKVQL